MKTNKVLLCILVVIFLFFILTNDSYEGAKNKCETCKLWENQARLLALREYGIQRRRRNPKYRYGYGRHWGAHEVNQQKKYMKQWKNECIKCRKEKPSWPWKKIEAFLEGQNGKDIGKDKNPEASGPDGSQDPEADEGFY